MATFSQDNSPLKIQTPLGHDRLLAVSLEGREKLNGDFELQVESLAPRDSAVPFHRLLGQEASLELLLPDRTQRCFHGIVWNISQQDSDEVFDRLRLTLKPRLALLGLTRRSRVFLNQSATEILQGLLASVGGAEFLITKPIPVRQQCTQYRETDLEFFLRLCSEEGISHFWRHGKKPPKAGQGLETQAGPDQYDHQLVLTDNTTILGNRLIPLEYRGQGTPYGNRQQVHQVRVDQSIRPASFRVLDSHFQTFDKRLDGEFSAVEAVRVGSGGFPITAAGSGWHDQEHSATRCFDMVNPVGKIFNDALSNIDEAQQARARSLAEGACAEAVRMEATGDCNEVSAGSAFRLQGHPWADGVWLAVETRHAVRVDGAYWSGNATGMSRDCRVVAAPIGLNQPPWPLIRKPRVEGVETAVVTGAEEAEPSLDLFGRVKVRFWFDRERSGTDTAGSCWLRVAQPWAGKGYGAFFWPRVGHEVAVGFEGGDPDRPVIIGSLYNGTNRPPFEMPTARYITGIKTKTQGGDAGKNFHLFLLGDEKGGETVLLHSEGSLISQQESDCINRHPGFQANFQG